MLRSSFCNYGDAYLLVSGNITVAAQAGDNQNNASKKVVFKNYAPFTDCIGEINSHK